jgi:hypothetical protein
MPQRHLAVSMQEKAINSVVIQTMAHFPKLIEADYPNERMLGLHAIVLGVVVHTLYFANLLHVLAKIMNNP